ncbi:hypothetical protein [Streptomyces sp. LS1784]|uniref:hypothetical protein n=1 Tax=Streptomyces sp. LS1784 TaxID=2851533 RepID=UPI001CC92727|nr:hypothetical protein [Streptomyces sp. LS1784]
MDDERGTVRSARAGVSNTPPHRARPPRSRRPAGEPPIPGSASPWILVYHAVTAEKEDPGGPGTGFYYPYGAVDLPAAPAVRDAGYDHACAIAHSPVTGRFALPRCCLGDRDGAWWLRAEKGRHRLRDAVTELRRSRREPRP